MAMGNSSKERDTWKGMCEAMGYKCSKFQKEMTTIQEKVRCVKALQDGAKVHESPSTLASHIIKLEYSLEVERKQHQETTTVVTQADYRPEEAQKSIQKVWNLPQKSGLCHHAEDYKTFYGRNISQLAD